MFKKIFSKKVPPLEDLKIHNADVVLRLMFEVAISDGKLDQSELDLIKTRALKIAPNDTKVSTIIKKIIDESENSVSLYSTVKKINETYSKIQKIEILKILWKIVAADEVIDAYEENLYFKIAELIKIKRSKANQIKQENY